MFLSTQACTGHPGALREETGESQQSVHGAQRYHAAAGDQRERTAQVCKLTLICTYILLRVMVRNQGDKE